MRFRPTSPWPHLWLLGCLRLAILGAAAAGIWRGVAALPNAYNPFTPIEIADEPTLLTRPKLRLLQLDHDICLATIARSGVGIAPDRIVSPTAGCGTDEGARLVRSEVSYGAAVRATCGEMAALMIWERHAVIPLSRSIFGSPVVHIHTYGTYSCRNINHAERGRLSQHATANAIDIAGFDLADGRKVTVKDDWGKTTDKGRFLRAVHDEACEIFSGVLSPDYNAFHANHFHFDMGVWTICR